MLLSNAGGTLWCQRLQQGRADVATQVACDGACIRLVRVRNTGGVYRSGQLGRSGYLAQLLQGYWAIKVAQLQVGPASQLRGSTCASALMG